MVMSKREIAVFNGGVLLFCCYGLVFTFGEGL